MSETELRWQLRQLPREIEPPHELWPGIATRLAGASRRPRRRPWVVGLALAASLGLVAVLAWPLRVPAPGQVDPQSELVQREADAMTREYQAALDQFEGVPLPAPVGPAVATLDQSAREIRAALSSDPDAAFLLGQLRRTYARRLSLTQRAVTG